VDLDQSENNAWPVAAVDLMSIRIALLNCSIALLFPLRILQYLKRAQR